MTRWERGVYYASLALVVVASISPLLVQIERGYRIDLPWPFDFGIEFLVLCFVFVPVAPFAVILGILAVSGVRMHMELRGEDKSPRPQYLVFIVCGIVWLLVSLTFWLVPLFAGESQVQRGIFDNWLDKLL